MTPDNSAALPSPDEVIAFWFSETARPLWFEVDAEFDAAVARILGPAWHWAAGGGLGEWEATPIGAVALAIILDQVPRNMFRGEPRAFSTDARARDVALRALERGFDRDLPPEQRHFFYLPFMHSEDLADQERCVELVRERLGHPDVLASARRHRDVIARFGRFPHRNAALNRVSSEEERRFLAEERPY